MEFSLTRLHIHEVVSNYGILFNLEALKLRFACAVMMASGISDTLIHLLCTQEGESTVTQG